MYIMYNYKVDIRALEGLYNYIKSMYKNFYTPYAMSTLVCSIKKLDKLLSKQEAGDKEL